jgi:lysozyme
VGENLWRWEVSTPNNIVDQLLRDEGLRLKPYQDTVGKLTIGVGRNLDDKGISKEEAMYLLGGDISEVEVHLDKQLPWTKNLDRVRYYVLVNLAFNMGISGLLQFKRTLAAIKDQRWEDAATYLLESKYADQTDGKLDGIDGARALRLAEQLRTGEWQ